MKKTNYLFILTVLFLIQNAWGAKFYQPSFDCSKVTEKDKVEWLICTEERIAEIDREMAKKYREAKETGERIYKELGYTPEEIKKAIEKKVISTQRSWIRRGGSRDLCLIQKSYWGNDYFIKAPPRKEGEDIYTYYRGPGSDGYQKGIGLFNQHRIRIALTRDLKGLSKRTQQRYRLTTNSDRIYKNCLMSSYLERISRLDSFIGNVKYAKKKADEERREKLRIKEHLENGGIYPPKFVYGTQIICFPDLGRVEISRQRYVLRTKKGLAALEKDGKKLYRNEEVGNVFTVSDDFNYECKLDQKVVRVEGWLIGIDNYWKKDILANKNFYKIASRNSYSAEYYDNQIKEIEEILEKYKPKRMRDLPIEIRKKYRLIMKNAYHIRLYSDNVLIADIDRFRGGGRGVRKIEYFGVAVNYNKDRMRFDLNIFDYKDGAWSTVTTSSSYFFSSPITYDKLLASIYEGLIFYKGRNRIVHRETKHVCIDKCLKYFEARDFLIRQIGHTLENYTNRSK